MGSCADGSRMFKVCKSPALPANALAGKVALITGGGTGLGKAMAVLFAQLGAQVAIAARRLDILEKSADEIRQSSNNHSSVIAIRMDVKDAVQVASAIDQIEAKFGRLPNIIVNNAAGNFIMASERLSTNAFRTIVDIVLMGTANVTLEVGRRLINAKQGGTFLSITTPYARQGAPFLLPSAVAKAGVENLTRSLANEWAKYGMRFNCIAPGPIKTEGAFGRLAIGEMHDAGEAAALTVPEGRIGEPEELANLAAFVVSDYGSWLNGAIIDFDGGQHLFNSGGSFTNALHGTTSDQWEQIETAIRARTGKTKSKV